MAGADLVQLTISSNMSQFGNERRFPRKMLISELKGKLELVTGVQVMWMQLELYNEDNELMHKTQDDKMLGYYSPSDQWRVHVLNTNPNKSAEDEYNDLSKVEKYVMSEEEYNKKEGSVRDFMMKNKVGKFSDEAQNQAQNQEEVAKRKEAEELEKAKKLKVGDRCETTVPKQPRRRGSVAYIGETEFKPGCWVGVKYDEPLGKNDGSVNGKRYFTCTMKYGGFVRPSQVEVGDFPEEDLGLSDDDEM